MTWLDRTARKRDRADATVRALTAVFTSDAVDLRDRAVKIAVKHAAHASEPVRAEVRDAAGGLPAELRAAIAGAFGEVEATVEPEPLMGPPPFVPREMPAPIGSLAELADEFAVRLRSEEEWPATERFLAALVEFAHRDLAGTREALRKQADDLAPWLTKPDDHPYMRRHVQESWIQFPVRNLLLLGKTHNLADVFAALALRRSRSAGTVNDPQLKRFLKWRLHGIASAVGTAPLLLATPTEASGHIASDILVGRLERLEAAGSAPGAPTSCRRCSASRAKSTRRPRCAPGPDLRVAARSRPGSPRAGSPTRPSPAPSSTPPSHRRRTQAPVSSQVLSIVDMPGDSRSTACAYSPNRTGGTSERGTSTRTPATGPPSCRPTATSSPPISSPTW